MRLLVPRGGGGGGAGAGAGGGSTQLGRPALRRRDYLASHGETLAAARVARAELDQRIDEIIDGYARMAHPPAWFRFGLGYPPRPGEQADWLGRARAEIAKRRRY